MLQFQSFLVVDMCKNKLNLNTISCDKESGPPGVMQAQDDVHCITLNCTMVNTNVRNDQSPENRK